MLELRSLVHQEMEETTSLSVCDSLLHTTDTQPSLTLKIKEEPEEQLVDDGQTQEVVLPFPEPVKEERDQPVTPDYNEQLLLTSDFSLAESDNYGSDEARLQKNKRTQKWKAPQKQKAKENVQTPLPDRESSARSPRDSRTCPVCGRGFRYMFHLIEHMKVHKSTSEKSEDTDTGSSHGNQSSLGFGLEIKEEPEEQLVDDGQTQEVVLPFPESVKEERDQLVTASASENENVQAALPDRESSARSPRDSRDCPVCGRGFRYMFHLTEHMKSHKRTSESAHTGERPYHCAISEKTLTQRSTLDAQTWAQTATLPLLTNNAAALAGEETSTQPSIKEEFNHDPSEPPGLSHTIINTENSHGNQSSLGFSLEIKEEPEEQLVDDGQTQEVVLPFPEPVKEERDQPVTPDYNEQLLSTSDFSVAESDNYGSDEARLQKNTTIQKWKAPQRQKDKEKVQAALPDRESSARSPRDSMNCPVCGRGFRYMFHLIEHMKSHKRTSESEKQLLSHLEGTQTENLVCKVCCKRFANRRNLQMHSKLHTGIKDLESQDCGKTLSKTDSHNPSEPPGLSHSIINTGNSHGNQSSLGFSLEIKEEPEEQLVDDGQTQEVVLPFPEPVKEERDQPVTASESEKEKENVQAALPDRESSARSQIDSRTCPVCGRGFRYTFHLREHMKSHKRTSEEEQLVDDGQTQEVVLPFPESVKEERDQPVTPNYNKQWHFSSDLSASESDNYGSDEEWVESKELQTNTWRWKASENVQAPLPDRESSARSQIDSRTCTVCGRGFRYIFDLRQHMAFHESTSKSKKKLLSHPEGTQNENLVCKVCGKRFTNPSALERHSKIHTGIKAFECQDCGKKFSRKGNLIKHTRTHTGEKPYHCDICGKTFSQISALNKHTKTHTATLPSLTNSAAALAGEETSTQPSIKEEFNHDPSEPPGLSHSIINTENSHGNQSSLGFSLEIKEEPEEQLVDDGLTNTWRWKSTAPQKQIEKEKENVQAALPDRESSARSFRDSRTCTVCGRAFRYMFDLRQHMKSHESTGKSKKKLLSHLEGTQNEKLVCKVCGKRFANRSSLRVHSKMHTGIKDYECQDCGKKFFQKASLIKHTRTHTGEKPYHCDICGKTFSQISALNNHSKTHTATLPSLTNSAAALAGEETSTQPSIKEEFNHDPSEPPGLSHSIINTENSHGNQSSLGFSLEVKEEPEEQLVDDGQTNTWRWKSTAPQKQSEKEKQNVQAALPDRESSARSFRDSRTCTVCGRGFRYMFDLRQHMKSHESTSKSKKKLLGNLEGTQTENLVCKVCSKRFANRRNLQTHSKIHTGIKDYECQDCGKTFVQKVHLIRHTRTHTGEKPYHCDICGEAFSVSSNLIVHMRTHTREKPYHCDICGEAFSRSDILNAHMRTHTGEKPYHCDICGEAFSHRNSLIYHMRKHTGEKPYHCDICGEAFIQCSNLNSHMRTHTGEKPYHCDICGKAFRDRSAFNNHTRTHTGEKPYHCDICGEAFSRREHLNIHIRTHTGEKPYHCDICGKAFSQSSNLNTHMRTHTG